jgi:hypothetical protein
VVTKTNEVEVIKERLVPVDERLTQDIPPPDIVPKTWRDVAIIAIHYRQRYEAFRERMAEIRGLGDGER